jgi:single-stranded DNA-specific DHH superfamily exonuclease
MISNKQIKEIRTLLESSKNPLFIFDDDPDGLCAFILLWRHVRRGQWTAFTHSLKNSHELLSEVEIRNPDLIVLLDMPVINQDFVDQVSIPIVHIDHHPPISLKGKHYHYYNPRVKNDEDNRPTTYWAYQVTKKDLWIGMVGMISDWFIPEYLAEFSKDYPDLISKKVKKPGQAYFETELGRLSKIFGFCLKGKKEDTNKCIKALLGIEGPYEILKQETPYGRLIHKYTDKINKRYENMLKDALETGSKEKVFLYTYPGSVNSFTSLISTELLYRVPQKVVIVARVKFQDTIMSIRSKGIKIPPLLERSLEGLQGYGGGHDFACGGKVKNEDFYIFLDRFKSYLK